MAFEDLYQEIILDHYRKPRNAVAFQDDSSDTVKADNPNCGDSVQLRLRFDEGMHIAAVEHACSGCAISVSSASMMSDIMRGKTADEARALARRFASTMRGEQEDDFSDMGDLAAINGVKKFPMRVKCATLAWHALEQALDRAGRQS